MEDESPVEAGDEDDEPATTSGRKKDQMSTQTEREEEEDEAAEVDDDGQKEEEHEDEEDKVARSEANFWDFFFQLVDILDGTSLQGEYNARAGLTGDRLHPSGDGSEMNWNFWIMGRKTSSFASYTIALKKAIDRIRKIGGFSRHETAKLKTLIDHVVRERRRRHRELSLAGAPGKTLDGHENAINLWIRVKKSLDNQPLDGWKIANFLCDATIWTVGVGLVAWVLVGIYHFFVKSE